MSSSVVFSIVAYTTFDGDDSIDVHVSGKTYCFNPRTFVKAISNLNCFASGNPCDFPHASLLFSDDGNWEVLVSPASMWAGADNSSAHFSIREFANMPETVLKNPTWKVCANTPKLCDENKIILFIT